MNVGWGVIGRPPSARGSLSDSSLTRLPGATTGNEQLLSVATSPPP
ncbi:hypothetical protein K3495_g9165 [Podosphaera aphanis]|nr:hypothetical protein K3495_g9165 [Podosphaera aphanis]